jgi:hypothetical protein
MAVLQRLQAAAGELDRSKGKSRMSQPDLESEISAAVVEPLLPIEKKLIGWSLGLGIGLLIVLIVLNQLFPIKL